jgi:hypothetical protein
MLVRTWSGSSGAARFKLSVAFVGFRGDEQTSARYQASSTTEPYNDQARCPLAFLRGVGLPDNLIKHLPSLLNQAIQFYSVFISYSHADKSFAWRLYNEHQGHGIPR